MAAKIQIRRDTAANWTSVDPVLANGEMGLETDTGKFKWGNGSSAWTALAYFSPPAAAHTLGGAEHTLDTLANLNAKISDATLVDTGDARFSDARTPTAHTHPATDVTDFDTEVSNNSSVTANTAKVTNATHTGEVTGSGALTVGSTAISNKTLNSSPAGTEEVLMNDAGTLKKTTVQDIADLAAGGSAKDGQHVSGSTLISTTSTTYVDMSGMSLTTSNSGTGDYMIWLNFAHDDTQSNKRHIFVINIDGVDAAVSMRDTLGEGAKGIATTVHFVSGLATGKVIKVRYKTGGTGNFQVYERCLMIKEV